MRDVRAFSRIIVIGLVLLGISVFVPDDFSGYPKGPDGSFLLIHSVEIDATPDAIWDYFLDIDKNYTTWHPDHLFWKWEAGKPFAEGSTFNSEQYMAGNLARYKGTITEMVPGRKTVMDFTFPVSLISPRIEWRIDSDGQTSTFTAVTHMRIGKLFRVLFRNQIKELIISHDRHVAEEGENLKRILE